MSPDSLTPVAGPEVIVSGLPATGNHVTKTILVTESGTLFVGVGSATDSCQAMPSVPGSLGIDPCPDLPIERGSGGTTRTYLVRSTPRRTVSRQNSGTWSRSP